MNTWKQENYNSVTYFVSNIKLIAQIWDFALLDAPKTMFVELYT